MTFLFDSLLHVTVINRTFLYRFVSGLQGINKLTTNTRNETVTSFIDSLSTNFTVNAFNFSSFFDNYLSDLNSKIVNEYLVTFAAIPLMQISRNCIRTQLNNVVNDTAVQLMKQNVQKLRKFFSALKEIKEWYQDDFFSKIFNVSFVEKCIDSFINLRCAKCTRDIPQLCQSTCNYLVQGCFVPYRVGLTFQLNDLWNVTQQLISQFEDILSRSLCDANNYLTVDFDSTTQLNAFVSY